MPIHAQCEHCGFGYAAPEAMAGKRVRCRNCGQVFAIPGSSAAVDDLDDKFAGIPQVPPLPPAERSADETRVLPAITTSQSNMSGGIGSAKSRMERGDVDPGVFGIAGEGMPSLLRPSEPFRFPYAGDMDAWTPRLVPLLMLAWLFWRMWRWMPRLEEGAPTNPYWAGIIPISLSLVLFVGVWLSIYAGVMKKISAALRFMLPGNSAIRAICVASLPFAFTGLFWLAGESLVTLVIGLFLGTGLTVLATWFLYRLKQTELVHAAVGLLIAGLISSAISVAAFFGANMVLNNSLGVGSYSKLFAYSPLGPGLSWVQMSGAANDTRKASPAAPAPPATMRIKPAEQPATPAPIHVIKPAETPSQPVAPSPVPTETPAVVPPPPSTPPGPAGPVAVEPAAPKDADVLGDNPVLVDGKFLNINRPIMEVVYPLVSQASIAARAGGSAEKASECLAVLSPSANGETDATVFELGSDPLPEKGTQPFATTPATPSYALSPDGEMIARVARFGENLMVQVHGYRNRTLVARRNVVSPVEPRLVGFINNTTLLSEQRVPKYSLAAWDLNTDKIQQYALGAVMDRFGHPVVVLPEVKADATERKSDPKSPVQSLPSIAMVGTMPTPMGVCLRVFQAGADGQRNPINIPLASRELSKLEPNPTGLAVSPDGSQVAVAFEYEGQLAIITCSLPNKVVTDYHMLPGGLGQSGAGYGAVPSNRLTWLTDDYLAYGNRIIARKTGVIAAALNLGGPVVQQHLVNPQTMHYVVSTPQGTRIFQAKIRR